MKWHIIENDDTGEVRLLVERPDMVIPEGFTTTEMFTESSTNNPEERLMARMEHNDRFWASKIAIKDDPRVVRAEGHHYWIGDENCEGSRGHGGRKIRIEFFDGRVVETSNLWHNGLIPKNLREGDLADNAKIFWLEFMVARKDILSGGWVIGWL